MPALPQRHSLVTQTVAILRREITTGTWRGWLPGERRLCALLRVSRNTLRAALEELQRARIIEAHHGTGHRILRVPEGGSSTAKPTAVTLLMPDPLDQLRPSQALWVDELRELLIEQGHRLRVLHGRPYFQPAAGRALQRLVPQHPSACWILTLGTEPAQRWFAQAGVPCVAAGSIYPGIDLPSVDLDYRALCRHAVGSMLAAGHRRIVFLTHQSRRAGDLEGEAGFLEGARGSRRASPEVQIVHHEPTVEHLGQAVQRLMQQARRPTALLVASSNYYLTVATRLAQLGLRVPRDVSLISRDEDPFLPFVLPAPARYHTHPHDFAKRLLRVVLELIEGGSVAQRQIRIVPEFFRGESLAAPPRAG
ncbi:MAG: substrate-binding domain-containing protein [Opitutaceae bacterium]|nr:substrate-binding domain-containing protein [Opitutaceae bacterium]